MTDIDTARIRAEFVQTPYSQVDVTISALCDEIDRLRDDLAGYERCCGQFYDD